MATDNFIKHTHKNPLQQLLINNFFKTLIKTIQPLHLESILDVGCGEGFTLNKLKAAGIGKKLEGIEYLDEAIKLGKKYHPDIVIKKGTIYDLPYKDNSFDLLLCTEVLEHLEYPKKALKELVRVTKRYCLLSVPNEPIFMASNFLRGKNLSRWGNDIEHINHCSKYGFEILVGKELQILKIKTPFPWTMILAEKI